MELKYNENKLMSLLNHHWNDFANNKIKTLLDLVLNIFTGYQLIDSQLQMHPSTSPVMLEQFALVC